jgi:ribosomal protein S18 acetylase RimI-like enzyme
MTPNQFDLGRMTLARAFRDYPLMVYAAPEDRTREQAVASLYGSILKDCLSWGQVYTTSDIAGVACWLPPGHHLPGLLRWIKAGMLKVPLHFGWTGFQRLQAYDTLALRMHHGLAHGDHWYLWVIGIRPEDQRQGLGGRLMQPILARADQESLPCYLETHAESNVRVYERQGFEVASKEIPVSHPLPVWGMVRRPKKP